MSALAKSSETGASGGGFVPSIQGLRGVAALSVLLVHMYVMPLLAGFLPQLPPWFHAIANTGGHGVELFFMISGYLIPASLVRHGDVSAFFYDRCMRILPVFVVLHLALFTIGPIVGYKFFKGIDLVTYVELFVANLLFLPDALGLPLGQQNAWTLSYEWAFYIWFAAIFASRRGGHWFITWLLIGIAVAAVVYRPNAAFFGIGMLLSRANFRLLIAGWPGLLAGALCVIAMYGSLEYLHAVPALLPGLLLFAMVLSPGSGVATLLDSPLLQYLGKISYSLYLVHPFALYPLQAFGAKFFAAGVNPWLLWAGFVAIGVPVAIVASALSYRFIEVALRRRLDRTLRGTPTLRAEELQQRA
jgi:peptidoglycan/LPS O-acetylase OafA/YrhL